MKQALVLIKYFTQTLMQVEPLFCKLFLVTIILKIHGQVQVVIWQMAALKKVQLVGEVGHQNLIIGRSMMRILSRVCTA